MNGFVILGATGAVGSALAGRLHRTGHSVFLAGRNSERLNELSTELDCDSTCLDAHQPGSIATCFEAAESSLGQITGVANCIGSLYLKPAHATSDADFLDVLQTNLCSAFETVRASHSAMRKSGGSVVLVSSAAASMGMPNHEAIAAAKAGVEGLMRSAAASYAARGIRINAVAPGLTKSNMTRQIWESEQASAASEQMHALGRLGDPDEVAAMIQWLLLDESSWITGQVFGVDGGLSSVLGRQKVKR